MSSVKAALRYAKALLALAQDKKVDRKLTMICLLFLTQYLKVLSYKSFFNSPVVHPEVMNKTLNALFPQVSKESSNLFATLVSNKRVDLLYHVASKYLACLQTDTMESNGCSHYCSCFRR